MLNLTKVSKYYQSDDNVTQALKDISLNFQLGEFVAVTGESGSGKTTLLNVISGLDSYEDGSMRIADDETEAYDQSDWEEYRKRYISFVFQNYNLIDAYTVYENIEIALILNHPNLTDKKTRILELIEQVGLSDHVHQKASKLSGGQKQRVAIARALAKDAPILVADEPTGNLDSKTAESIVRLMREVSKDKLVIFVTHEYELVKDVATRRIRIFDGEVVEDKTMQSFDAHTYEEIPLKRLTLGDKLKLALKNLKSTPKKTLFTGLISLFIVAVFASSYGAYVQQSNVSNATFHPLFENLHPSRLVITKQDAGVFSEAELDEFRSSTGVEAVVELDPVLDLYGLIDNQNPGFLQTSSGSTQFIVGDASNLIEGRLPDTFREIVLNEEMGYAVGDIATVNLSPFAYRFADASETSINTVDMVVVGLHNEPNNVQFYGYVSEAFLNSDTVKAFALNSVSQWGLEYEGRAFSSTFEIQIDPRLDKGEVILADYYIAEQTELSLDPQSMEGESIVLTINHPYLDSAKELDVTVKSVTTTDQTNGFTPPLTVSNAWVSELANEPAHQIGLLMDGSFSANQLNDELSTTYIGIYPASYQNPFEQIFAVIGNIFQGFTSVILLLIMYFVSYLVLKNVIRAQERSTLILRSIGAYKKDLYQTLIFELMIVMMAALFIVVGFLYLNQAVLNWVPNYLQFFAWNNYLVMTVLLLGLAILLGRRFQKKLFTRSVMSALRSA